MAVRVGGLIPIYIPLEFMAVEAFLAIPAQGNPARLTTLPWMGNSRLYSLPYGKKEILEGKMGGGCGVIGKGGAQKGGGVHERDLGQNH